MSEIPRCPFCDFKADEEYAMLLVSHPPIPEPYRSPVTEYIRARSI